MLIISKKNNSVRRAILFLLSHILIFAGIIFTLEIVLVFLGIGDIFIPLTRSSKEFLSNWMF